jgi:hypothetical protein
VSPFTTERKRSPTFIAQRLAPSFMTVWPWMRRSSGLSPPSGAICGGAGARWIPPRAPRSAARLPVLVLVIGLSAGRFAP